MSSSSEVALFDDRVFVRDCLAATLATMGLQVAVTAGSPEELLAGLAALSPAVAVLTFAESKNAQRLSPDAARLLEVLKDAHPRLASVVLAPSADPVLERECRERGAVAYFNTLATHAQTLGHTVSALCRGERPGDWSALLERRAPDANRSPLTALSTREREVLGWIAAGADNLKISSHLEITERTVKAHVSAIYRKLGAENRAQLALLARQLGVMPSGQA